MFAYRIEDMRCAHCVQTIRAAVLALDPAAGVEIDLDRQRLAVASGTIDSARIVAALADAGYRPVPLP